MNCDKWIKNIPHLPHFITPTLMCDGIRCDHDKTGFETILQEAQRLVHGDRGEAYGHPLDDFSKTAKIWSAILGIDVTPQQVALCMVGVKISREVNAPKRDNRVDGAGYFETLDMVEAELERRRG